MLSPETAGLASASRLATTVGWGVSDNASKLLQDVHVPIVSEDSCAASYPEVRSFQTQLCAGAIAGGIDSCQGDSGGPLLVRDAQGKRWMHAGITSWGDGCGLPGKPGIYGRTSAMSTWAAELMSEVSTLAYDVDLDYRDTELAFANRATTRPLIGEISPRWSISNLTLPEVADSRIAADTPMTVRFFLFSEAEFPGQEFDCELDLDGPGPNEASGFSCRAGINQVQTTGYPDGIYLPHLSVASAGASRSRDSFLIAGTPTTVETTGDLSATDPSDPDYSGTYYIDYLEVSAAELDRVALVEVEAEFAVQVGLYDADVRTSAGGGTLQISTDQSLASMHFVPQEGRHYLLGVSSLGSQATGSYTLRLINNGTPTPVSL
jgi:hypothetical protein